MNTSPEWRLWLLGTYRLERNGQEIHLPRRKAASLLAYLALHPQRHGRSRLGLLLWLDTPLDAARCSLRTAMCVLRRQMGAGVMLADVDNIQLNPDFPLWTDAAVFQSYADRFLTAPALTVSASFLDLYKGELLPDVFDDWLLPERQRLWSLYLSVLSHMSERSAWKAELGRGPPP